MDKYFICLANSYKHKGRCIGGIELIMENGVPKRIAHGKFGKRILPVWVRPICHDTDAIPNNEALLVSPLDIIKLVEVTECPTNAQYENCYYSAMEVVGRYDDGSKLQDLLSRISNFYNKYWLFGNKGKAVHPDKYAELDHSLILIKPTNARFKLEPRPGSDVLRLRVEFQLQDFKNEITTYDLPVTDPVFCHTFQDDLAQANSYGDYYFTVSLGVEHDGWHSKLVAQVFYFNPI